LQDSNLNVGQTNWFHFCGRLWKIISNKHYKLISIYIWSSVLDSRDYYKPSLEHRNCVINGYNGPSSTWATSRPGPVRNGKTMKFLHATLFLCFIHSEEKNIILFYLARPYTNISTAFCFSPYQEIEARGIENYSSSLLLISNQKPFKK
jgi:hypothetical protein